MVQLRRLGALVVGLGVGVVGREVQANERHFTYTYESAVLPQGARELEVSVTNRVGRENRYNAFDQRLEFEYGITDRLLTAFYLNSTASVAQEDGVKVSSYEFEGVSSEWKYKLSDAFADAVGSALYGEVSYGPEALELEAKLIVDKRVGKVHLAGNLAFEQEWEDLGGANEGETVIEPHLAAAFFATDHVSVGLEARMHFEAEGGEFEGGALFAGPVIAAAGEGLWVALSFMPQIGSVRFEEEGEEGQPAEHPAEGGGGFSRDLQHQEKLNARLLMGYHF